MRATAFVTLVFLSVTAPAVARAADLAPAAGLPGLPGADGAPPVAAAPAAAPDTGPSLLEKVRRGVVLLEREGRLLGFGTVLQSDGRVLTALSALGGGETVNVRYADGSSMPAKVGHRDKAWDLALLVPQSAKWKDGLAASNADPGAVDLRAPIPLKAGAKPIALPVRYKGRLDALSKEGEALVDAMDIEMRNSLPLTGAPLLDPAATVVGVVVRACKLAVTAAPTPAKESWVSEASEGKHAVAATPGCSPMLVGAPVAALRSFLSHTPASAVAPAPWLGIVGQADAAGSVHGVRVMAVAPSSPAEKGGLRSNADRDRSDLIVAVNGQPVETPEKLAEAIGKRAIGETVKLLVLGAAATDKSEKGDKGEKGDKAPPAEPDAAPTFHEVAVVLRPSP